MSFFFGGSFKSKPQFTGLATQTSTSALPIPIVWGQNRVAPNIFWQDDFKSHKKKQKAGKGGPKMETYTYSASFQLGLCWGEINDVVRVWKDQSKENDYTKLGFTLFKGTTPQSPWGYLTSAHPNAALGYSGIAYLAAANYDLGQGNSLPQHSFEVQGLRWDTGAGSGPDADPALIIEDFLTDPSFGVGFDLNVLSNLFSTVDAPTTGDGTFQTYCQALGFALSPSLTGQNAAGETIQRWANLCNTAIAWTGYTLKFHPWGPDEITNNGVKYVPDFPVRYSLSDKDFIYSSGEDPITFNRVDPADATNSFSIIIANRQNEYNDLPVPWKDQGLIDQYGLRREDNLEAKEVCDPDMGAIMVTLMGQRKGYVRNSFQFKLPPKFCRLEPMDVLECYDPRFGTFECIIAEINETDEDDLEITADEYSASISRTPTNATQDISNTPVNTLVPPGSVNPPIIFEPPTSLSGSHQVWAAVSGGDGTTADPNWGGALVWISTDNTTFDQIGEVEGAARQGKLTANLATHAGPNPDTTNTLKVSLLMSGGELSDAASAFDAENGATVSYVDGEFISYQTTNLTSPLAYDLTDLWRGQYGSTVAGHLNGAPFARLDDNIFKYDVPAEYIGKTIYLKFQSVNLFGSAGQDLADCVSYPYTISGEAYGTGTAGKPSMPTGLVASGLSGFIAASWNANSVNDNVTGYKYYRAAGHGAAFGTATLIATVSGASLDYVDTSAGTSTDYTVFLTAINDVGESSPTAGVNVTTATIGAPQPFGFAFTWVDPVENNPIAYFDSPISWTMKAGLPDSQGSIGDSPGNTAIAPSAQTDFDIQSPPGTSIGTMRFAASSFTATFILASDQSIPLGQPVAIIAPSSLNGLQGTVYGSLLGKR